MVLPSAITLRNQVGEFVLVMRNGVRVAVERLELGLQCPGKAVGVVGCRNSVGFRAGTSGTPAALVQLRQGAYSVYPCVQFLVSSGHSHCFFLVPLDTILNHATRFTVKSTSIPEIPASFFDSLFAAISPGSGERGQRGLATPK